MIWLAVYMAGVALAFTLPLVLPVPSFLIGAAVAAVAAYRFTHERR